MTQMMKADDDVLLNRTWPSFPGRWTQFPLHQMIMTMIIIIIMMVMMIIHHVVAHFCGGVTHAVNLQTALK